MRLAASSEIPRSDSVHDRRNRPCVLGIMTSAVIPGKAAWPDGQVTVSGSRGRFARTDRDALYFELAGTALPADHVSCARLWASRHVRMGQDAVVRGEEGRKGSVGPSLTRKYASLSCYTRAWN